MIASSNLLCLYPFKFCHLQKTGREVDFYLHALFEVPPHGRVKWLSLKQRQRKLTTVPTPLEEGAVWLVYSFGGIITIFILSGQQKSWATLSDNTLPAAGVIMATQMALQSPIRVISILWPARYDWILLGSVPRAMLPVCIPVPNTSPLSDGVAREQERLQMPAIKVLLF